MKKKMIIAAVFVCAIAITASAAFAGQRHHRGGNNGCCPDNNNNDECCPSVEVNADSNANVYKNLRTRTNSGDNYVSAGFLGTSNLTSGNVVAGTAVTDTVDGTWIQDIMPDTGKVEVNADSNAYVTTRVRTSANSGRNHVESCAGGANATTGSANSQTNSATTITGSTIYGD